MRWATDYGRAEWTNLKLGSSYNSKALEDGAMDAYENGVTVVAVPQATVATVRRCIPLITESVQPLVQWATTKSSRTIPITGTGSWIWLHLGKIIM